MPFTAFTGRRKAEHVTARLIVRRVKRLNPTSATGQVQDELFAGYRYHGVFTDSPLPDAGRRGLPPAARHHRAGDRRPEGRPAGPPAVRAVQRQRRLARAGGDGVQLTRAAGALASVFHARATTATIRDQLIVVPARLARSARRLVLHLPRHWPWQAAWAQLHTTVTATGPPGRA